VFEFVTGYGLGFVTGVAMKNVRSARRITALGLSLSINVLDVMQRWVAGQESEFMQLLNQLESASAEGRVSQAIQGSERQARAAA
jgi:hypothetical protein